ncbi:hypothetical protein [Chlamydiifrater volucris]|uniref:hypothetical protein n=1 Tax=Chlamydiifrater volucris TaxID=2681470 RepID=UPI0032B1E894
MLSFFYKNRKFVVVLMVAAMGVSGFGVSLSYLGRNSSKRDMVPVRRGTALVTPEGIKISHRTLHIIANYLARESTPFSGRSTGWNFLNDNFVTREVLTSKIGEALFLATYSKEGFPAFAKEIEYKPYRRFDAPFISSEEIWKSSAPTLSLAFHKFKSIKNPSSKEGYEARVSLFAEEKRFPYTLLRDMAEYRRRTYALPHDPLAAKDKTFKLFGYSNVSDWFGTPFINALSEVVVKFASFCESKGLSVSKKEVEREFLIRAKEAYEFVGKKDCSSLDNFISCYLSAYNVPLKEFLVAYKYIIEFQRGLNQVKGSFSFDYEPFREFFAKSKDHMLLDCYRFPKELIFHSRADLEAFETYLRLTAIPSKNVLDIPSYYLPVKSVKAKESRLVGRRFIVSYSSISSAKEMEPKLSVSEIRDWQRDPQNSAVLSAEFPAIFNNFSDNFDKDSTSFKIDLKTLDAETRSKVDNFSKKEIIRSRPHEVAKVLASKEKIQKEIFLSFGKDFSLEGISDGAALSKVLMEADSIPCFTQDGNIYYAFEVEERFDQEEIVSFKEAFRKDILKTIVADHKGLAPMQELLEVLSLRYQEDKESVRILKRMSPILEEHRMGSVRTGTINWLPEKVHMKVYRTDPPFPDTFSEMEKYIGNSSPVKVRDKEGVYYYVVHEAFQGKSVEEVEQLTLVEKQLANEVLGDYLVSLVCKR